MRYIAALVRPLALTLALLCALPARAEPATVTQTTSRSMLSALGVTLLGVGVAGIGLGFGGIVSLGETEASIAAYFRSGTPAENEAGIVRTLRDQESASTSAMIAGFVIGGLAIAGGITCLVLDRPVQVAFAPTLNGGTVVVTARF